jgi:hypothetical protein
MSDKHFISMAPHPNLIRAALAHCEIPMQIDDDGQPLLPSMGWSDGHMCFNDSDGSKEMISILSGVLTTAMVKHMEDTMILPTNVSRLREQASFLRDISDFGSMDPDDRVAIEGIIETIDRVADNLDPSKR